MRLGIRLTQVAAVYRLWGDGRVSAEPFRVGGQLFYGRKLQGLSGKAALAGGVPLPALRRRQVVAGERDAAGVRWLWVSDVGDGGDNIPGYPDAFGRLVSGDVVGDHAEEWCQRLGTTAGVGLEEVRDGLDLAA